MFLGLHGAVQYREGFNECRAVGHIPPPPFVRTRGLSKHGDPVFPHFRVFFGNHRFCGSNPIENVVCSVVQAAGRVYVGVGVAVIPCALVSWGVCWAVGHPFVVMKGKGLAYVCSVCSVVRAAL